MRALATLALVLFTAACAVPVTGPMTGPGPAGGPLPAPAGAPAPDSAPEMTPASAQRVVDNFFAAMDRVMPVAEQVCQEETRNLNCDFAVVVDRNPELPPNAFQTLDDNGRPVIGFTLSLIAEARNQDELAFIFGHESAHHIAGHLSRTRASAQTGAAVAGVLARLGGADAATVRTAQQLGADVGARRYSKGFELEADSLGTVIAARAGFDPVHGAEYFNRTPDPGNAFLGTHPPNAERIAVVRETAARLRGAR